MKTIVYLGVVIGFIFIQSCTKQNFDTTATNTITVTTNANSAMYAATYTLPVIPSTTVLAAGTPFYITGSGVIPQTGTTVQSNLVQSITIDLNNSQCSYPNFVSGTYNLCNANLYINGYPTCSAGTNNTIFGSFGSSSHGGTVVVNFNNGIATGTFNFEVMGIGRAHV